MIKTLSGNKIKQILNEEALQDFYEYTVGSQLIDNPEDDEDKLYYEHDFMGWLLSYERSGWFDK